MRTLEQTFGMIKPDATQRNLVGKILDRVESAGFKIVKLKMIIFTKTQAQEFYSDHKDKAFFDSLVDYITSGLVVGFVLEKENAINDYRELIGSTNPKEAHIGTVRSDYGIETSKNSVHGSDCESSVIKETKVFFA